MDEQPREDDPQSSSAGAWANPDQAAVAEYLGSGRYQRARAAQPTSWRFGPPPPSPTDWLAPGLPSLFAGPAGMAAIVLAFGILFPLGMKALEEFVTRPSFVPMMMLIQTLLLPPLISFGFAVVTPMFWYGRVSLRFALALLSTIPGCLGFAITASVLDNLGPDDFWVAFTLVMFASLLASAAVAVAFQFWSRWTMVHERLEGGPIPVPGIQSMIELTAIAAVGYLALVSTESAEYMIGILFFSALALLNALAVIAALIVYFRTVDGTQSRKAAMLIGLSFAFLTAFVFNGFFAVMEFGWDVLAPEVLRVSMVSLYGALISLVVIWMCLRWLRLAGWKCVDRRRYLRTISQTADPGGETP